MSPRPILILLLTLLPAWRPSAGPAPVQTIRAMYVADVVALDSAMAVLYRAALGYPLFTQIVHQPSALFPDRTGYREIRNQDRLLRSYPGFIGGKSGYTDLARETYVGMAQRNGRRLIVVQMYGSDDLWDQAARLLDWGFAHYRQ